MKTPEDEFNSIIDDIELRAMAADGPVTPTLQAATEEELSRLWELVNEISPKRKALARAQLKGNPTSEEVNEYLRMEGLDPANVGREGSVFVKTAMEKIRLEKLATAHEEYIAVLLNELDSVVGSAYVHGWRSQNVEAGEKCRAKIDEIKAQKKEPSPHTIN